MSNTGCDKCGDALSSTSDRDCVECPALRTLGQLVLDLQQLHRRLHGELQSEEGRAALRAIERIIDRTREPDEPY